MTVIDARPAPAHFVNTIRPLRRLGYSCREIAQRCDPPISHQRVYQLWCAHATTEDREAFEATQERIRRARLERKARRREEVEERRRRRPEQARERYIASIRAWHDLFGEPPSVADWNATTRRRSPWREQRYRSTGRRWPSSGAAPKVFGSWTAALAAAGYQPKPTGRPVRRKPGGAAHVRGILATHPEGRR